MAHFSIRTESLINLQGEAFIMKR